MYFHILPNIPGLGPERCYFSASNVFNIEVEFTYIWVSSTDNNIQKTNPHNSLSRHNVHIVAYVWTGTRYVHVYIVWEALDNGVTILQHI